VPVWALQRMRLLTRYEGFLRAVREINLKFPRAERAVVNYLCLLPFDL
jgi:hypothetical protein